MLQQVAINTIIKCVTTGISYAVGDRMGLRRNGSTGVVTAEYYRNGVWTVMKTFTNTYTAKLYIHSKIPTASAQINNLRGIGVVNN